MFARTTILFLLLCGGGVLAAQTSQDYRVPAANRTIDFRQISELIIEGYDGSELVITGNGGGSGSDSRSDGLRRISASGLRDNTGAGLYVKDTGEAIEVRQVGNRNDRVRVRVPNSATVVIKQTGYNGSGVDVRDFGGSLDVSMQYHPVRLRNVSGPVAVHCIYSNVIAEWEKAPTEEVRLHSTYAKVDATLPTSVKADLRMKTSYGDMYTDFDVQITENVPTEKERIRERAERQARGVLANPNASPSESPQPQVVPADPRRWRSGYDVRYGEEDCDCDESDAGRDRGGLSGTLNGGGKLISLSATYDNIYLRKR